MHRLPEADCITSVSARYTFQLCSSYSLGCLFRGTEAVLWKTEHSWKPPGCPEWSVHSWQEVGRASELWTLGWGGLEMSLVWHKKALSLHSQSGLGFIPLPQLFQGAPGLLCHAQHKALSGLTKAQHQTNSAGQIKISLFSPCPSTLWVFHPISSPALQTLQQQEQNFPNISLLVFPLVLNANVLCNSACAQGPFTLFKGCQSGVNLSIDFHSLLILS